MYLSPIDLSSRTLHPSTLNSILPESVTNDRHREAEVMRVVYRRFVELVSTFVPDLRESPTHLDDIMDEQMHMAPFRIRY